MRIHEVGDEPPQQQREPKTMLEPNHPSTGKITEVSPDGMAPAVPGPPQDWPNAGVVMSNFDQQIDPEVSQRLSAAFGEHTAWNFHGRVWHSGGRYHEQVWVHHQPVRTLHAGTLEELMCVVNDAFGWA